MSNFGEGNTVDFHGAFREKADAVGKEKKVHGFIKGRHVGPGDFRYVVMTKKKENPLFTRSEKRRARHKIRHRVKGAARRGFASLFGIDLSPGLGGGKSSRRAAHRSSKSASGPSTSAVRSDVISALRNLGYSKSTAERMTPTAGSSDTFDGLFRRAVQKNPGELVIFGNPAKVYGREQIRKAKRMPNMIPAAILEGLAFAVGEKAGSTVLRSGRKRKKRNPSGEDQAADLFRTFHHREPAGVDTLELQRGNKRRKDYTILGPLVAIGTNAEKFEEFRRSLGKRNFENYKVDHWDKLPHMAFMTNSQVEFVKKHLEDPSRYIDGAPLLGSSPNGKQLYVISTDPLEIDLRMFDTDTSKDFVDLGEATFVVYVAQKPDTPYEWVHELGEDGGVRPRLMFDKIRKELFLIGGSYTVEAPGILN